MLYYTLVFLIGGNDTSYGRGDHGSLLDSPGTVVVSGVLHVMAYELSRTVNDPGRDVPGRLRRPQRCHQGRRRWTRAMNFSTA